MKNVEIWRPSKFVLRQGRLCATRNHAELGPASRFICDVLAPQYQEMIQQHAIGRLLDLGAGAVPLYEAYRHLVDSVTCVDWANTRHGGRHIDIEADLNAQLPLEDAGYETVLMTDVLEHVHRPHELLAEVARILTPGGKLLLAMPFMYWVHEAPHDYARYTAFMLRKLCQEAGLITQSIDATGGSPEVLLDMLGKHLAWSVPLAVLYAHVASGVRCLPGVRQVSRYSARWFPLGYLLVAQKPGDD
jgi:SAM-dependent methyltransferase